jgi:itaconyl-CoA hydratase
MNSAQGHFNEEAAKATPFGQRMTFGGYTAALVIGLSSQDTSENALAELTLNKIRFGTPVFAGDTIIAFTEVLAVSGDDPAAGIVHFKHWGVNQDDKVVFEGERKVLVKRRGARP